MLWFWGGSNNNIRPQTDVCCLLKREGGGGSSDVVPRNSSRVQTPLLLFGGDVFNICCRLGPNGPQSPTILGKTALMASQRGPWAPSRRRYHIPGPFPRWEIKRTTGRMIQRAVLGGAGEAGRRSGAGKRPLSSCAVSPSHPNSLCLALRSGLKQPPDAPPLHSGSSQ